MHIDELSRTCIPIFYYVACQCFFKTNNIGPTVSFLMAIVMSIVALW